MYLPLWYMIISLSTFEDNNTVRPGSRPPTLSVEFFGF